MTVSEVVAKMLYQEGVRHIFGIPGGENIHFMEAARKAGLQYVLVKQEGNAAFMADMVGQLTLTPGVCLSTLGPGSTNLVNGMANALLDRSPMLAFTAQVARHRVGTWTHQYIDHRRLFSPVTKLSAELTPHNAAPLLRRATRLAAAPRPGPVHLELSGDIGADEALMSPLPPLGPEPQFGAVTGEVLEEVLSKLKRAKRPLVLAGLSAARSGAEEALVAFAEAWSLPVVTTAKSKGVMPEHHDLFAGVVDMAAPQVVADFVGSADLILAAGFDAVELIKDWRYKAPVIHLDTVPNADQVYPAELEVVGDISVTLRNLTAEAEAKWSPEEVKAHRRKIHKKLVEDSSSTGLAPHQVILACREAFPDDTILTTDVGSHKLLVSQLWEARRPQSVFQSNGLSAMGFAFPGAIAAALTAPERPVLCIAGDGGFSMSLAELELVALHNLPIVSVVLSDGSLNRIQVKQDAQGYPHTGTKTMTHHFAKVAEAFGVQGVVAEDKASLERAIAEARDAKAPVVIEAVVDPSEYTVQF